MIRVNVALNFPGASPSPSTLHRLPLPSPGVTPGARQCSTSAPALGAVVADTETIDPKAAQERAAGSDSTCPAFASAATINGDSTRPLSPPPVFVAEAGVPVTTVPLIWGESSVEAEEFGAEVVVMSDVVYDPAGAVRNNVFCRRRRVPSKDACVFLNIYIYVSGAVVYV